LISEVRQDEQGAQEAGGAGGIGAELGEDPQYRSTPAVSAETISP
jgi:hypothetical protein